LLTKRGDDYHLHLWLIAVGFSPILMVKIPLALPFALLPINHETKAICLPSGGQLGEVIQIKLASLVSQRELLPLVSIT